MSKRSISEVSVSDVHDGPSAVIGSFFKGFRAPRDTKFQLYRKKASKEDFLLHGENDRLEYQGETGQYRKCQELRRWCLRSC